ncbi:MAG: ribosomal RNA small subunit methyltransferase A [Planctomycetes bacterium]|nr:ribosomal RNA small subunit methyltransferase A [Planctomycetota bacterium]
MNAAERQTRTHLTKLFAQHGFFPRGDLGQNFLIDLNIVQYVADQAFIGPDDVVLEVGTGTGGLTTFLAREAADVVTVEYDQNVFGLAQQMLDGLPNVTLINADALKSKNQLNPDVLAVVEEKLRVDPDRKLKLVANLPYDVATPVISNLVASELPWVAMVVTIQLELAQRMAAQPKAGSNFGALSIWLQSQCQIKLLKKLGPQVFWPRPDVDSAILSIRPDRDRRALITDRAFFHDLVRGIFTQRRKHLRVVLASFLKGRLDRETIDGVLLELGLKPDVRAESLEVETFVSLSNRLHDALSKPI